ncbi:hypothetical protein QYE76_014985 [Lolium multiflorum]|uniref:CCHC-type domain-containing protein n=1 Tax=Lolium multiflorum TaxID=4521 RepID=A0AAD8QI90_LOLMU|nr:hypothetical protein QYE76_059134 [Lolium multiflorum]KAK1698288.1 hypothetical protein QYE76_014985 [Lolium multiflorum]
MTKSKLVVVANGASLPEGSPLSDPKAAAEDVSNKTKAAESSSMPAPGGEAVADMMRRLKLTSKEATPLILDDEGDDDPLCPEWALMGKVLAPNILHVNTITAVIRPAWGNPKGLVVRPMGPNLFLAEFGSEADKTRVAKGGPWFLGNKHAILLKDFDVTIKPEDVVFDRLPIWVRLMSLDFGLMNAERGTPLAAMVGVVEHVEVDENGKAWGQYLRARVVIDPTQPIMRCVSVYSRKKNTTIIFDVMYERLPMFCFSCGVLGHSSVVCPTPADRDAEGKLPYHGDKFCVPDRKKKEAGTSTDHSQPSKNSYSGNAGGSGTQMNAPSGGRKAKNDGQGEAISPMMRSPSVRKPSVPRKNAKNDGKDVVSAEGDRLAGLKRKQPRQIYKAKISNTVPPAR